jgi:hypothetical protein
VISTHVYLTGLGSGQRTEEAFYTQGQHPLLMAPSNGSAPTEEIDTYFILARSACVFLDFRITINTMYLRE